MSEQVKMSAVILGYTGETGKELVKTLATCPEITSVTLLGRRDVELQVPPSTLGKFVQKRIDFEQLANDTASQKSLFANHNVAFCCLGTTRGKAGADGFVRVDKDYCEAAIGAAKAAGVQQFHLVSAAGANKNSCVLYSRVKGQVEETLATAGFQRSVAYWPKMLLCDRQESRLGEQCVFCCFCLCIRACPMSIGTHVSTLSKAMTQAAVAGNSANGHAVLENPAIYSLAEVYDSTHDAVVY